MAAMPSSSLHTLVERLGDLAAHAAVKEQIFRRITGQREFGKDDQLRSQPIARIGGRFENARDIAFDVAYEEIELGERNADVGVPLTSCAWLARLFAGLRRARRASAFAIAEPEVSRRVHGTHSRRFERREFVGGSALAAGDDRARMAHALARRRRDAGDVGDDRLGDVAVE